MKPVLVLFAAAALASTGFAGQALAQGPSAVATADLNIRSGPGPQYASIGFIAAGDATLVEGCLDAGKWCRVNYNGTVGWSYSDYLTADVSGQAIVLTERYPEAGLSTVTFDATDAAAAGGAVTGATTGAVVGALIGGPIGAAVGGIVGAAGGAAGGAAISDIVLPDTARAYIAANPMEPVYLDGEVVIGAGVPDTVVLQPVPDYQYSYVYINGQPVLVDPTTRQIVYVVR